MKIKDRIYGEVEITEPVLLEIINSPALQRLKGVSQFGYFEPFFPGTSYSRFEHSVGVCLLLRKYGASLEEQIAGLIHDVSHSAFSHCIDYVLKEGSGKKHDHQDNIFNNYILATDIPDIIKKYEFELKHILDDKRHPLKEQELPGLCADRIDYSLRNACVFTKNTDINYYLDNLIIENNNWIFKNFESAKKYSVLFSSLDYYNCGLPSATMFLSVGDYLKHALSKEYISLNDLYTTDQEVLLKIGKYHTKDEHLKLLFDRMNNKIGCKNNPNDFDSEVFCKSRVVDPLSKNKGKIIHVSEIDSEWRIVLEKESEPKKYFLKFDK